MKIKMKDIIELSAVLLQLDNVLILLDNGQSLEGEQRLKAQAELDFLLRCANIAVDETATEYVHLKTSENMYSTDGEIPYINFNRPPVHIYGVKQNGEFCRYKLFPNSLITNKGDVEVLFTYKPEKKDIEGELDFEDGKVSTRILSYGTAAEYSVVKGLFEEALIWDKRYKDCLFSAMKSLKAARLPQRSWF